MANKFVGRFNAAASDREPSQPKRTIVEALSVPVQIAYELADELFGLRCLRLHAAQSGDGVAHFAVEQTAKCCLNPFEAFGGFFAVMDLGHLVEVLRTVVEVKHLAPVGKTRCHVLPEPIGTVSQKGYAHFILRNPFGSQGKVCSELLLVLDLMPARDVHNPLPADQVNAETLGFFVLSSPPFDVSPGLRAGWKMSPIGCHN